MREERRPGTTRYRRSTCGCGAFGHKHDEQAFQPKWWNSSPTSVAATLPMILEYDDDFGSTSTTAMRSGDFRSAPSLLGAERDKNLDQASTWACDLLLSRPACIFIFSLASHRASGSERDRIANVQGPFSPNSESVCESGASGRAAHSWPL